ncbi:hypothetical protein RND81_12G070900 [Saponaria officinalis]|uniref:CCHC-type domain-containing protein n=1 Tax=Saponaria officinalis TaxID=3572 RepID=A0AAW1H7K6_SAPOF
MAVHTSQFGKPRGNSRQAHDDRDKTSLNAIASQLFTLSMKVDNIQNAGSSNTHHQQVNALVGQQPLSCANCGMTGHHEAECMGTPETVNAFQNWRQNAPYQNQPGYDRSMLSYKSQNILNPSLQPNPQSNAPPPPQNTYVAPHWNFQPTSNYPYQRPQQYHRQYAHRHLLRFNRVLK